MYLVSVYFDDPSNRILQRYMEQIAEVSGNQFMTEHKVPPHMTISSIEARSVEVLRPAFEALRDKLPSGEISFVSVGQLLPYVFYVTPVMNKYLQDLSKQVFEAFCGIPDTNISRLYQPYSWLAHVTLGKKLTAEQMQQTFALMQKQFVPFTAKVEEIGLAKVNPHEDVVRFSLSAR